MGMFDGVGARITQIFSSSPAPAPSPAQVAAAPQQAPAPKMTGENNQIRSTTANLVADKAAHDKITTNFKVCVASIVGANDQLNAANDRLSKAIETGDPMVQKAALAEVKAAVAEVQEKMDAFPKAVEAMKTLPPAEKDPYVPMLKQVTEVMKNVEKVSESAESATPGMLASLAVTAHDVMSAPGNFIRAEDRTGSLAEAKVARKDPKLARAEKESHEMPEGYVSVGEKSGKVLEFANMRHSLQVGLAARKQHHENVENNLAKAHEAALQSDSSVEMKAAKLVGADLLGGAAHVFGEVTSDVATVMSTVTGLASDALMPAHAVIHNDAVAIKDGYHAAVEATTSLFEKIDKALD